MPIPTLGHRLSFFAALDDLPPQALPAPSEYFRSDPFFNSFRFDPAPDLRKLSVPFLSLLGERDVVGVPVARSVEILTAILESAGNESFEIKVLDGTTHALDNPPETRHPEYVSTVMAWLDRYLDSNAR